MQQCLQFLNSNHHYVLYCIKVKAIIKGNMFKTEKKWESVSKEVNIKLDKTQSTYTVDSNRLIWVQVSE